MHSSAHLVRGLGAYPTADCYDPNRPSWWPYWLNTPIEAQCVGAKLFGQYEGVNYKTVYPNPPAPTPPGVAVTPVTESNPTGAVTPEQARAIQDQLIADANAATKSSLQNFFSDLAAQIDARTKGCNWYQVKGDDGTCSTGGTLLWLMVGGAGILAVVLAVKRK